MANDFELDFGDFSPDYDLDYDFGEGTKGAKKPKKKGDVIKEFASGLWEGVTDGLTGYGVPQRLIKSMLPRSYGPALDTVDRSLRFKDDLYDKVRENTKDTVYEFRELTREAMSIYGNKVPAKLASRLEAWANASNSDSSWQDYVTEDGSKIEVDADTGDLLDALTHGTAANAELSQAQHQEMMAALAAGAVANQKDSAKQSVLLDQILTMQRRLVGHTETITSTYQRRSLELQYRHYKLDISVAKMQEQYYKRSLEAFSNMISNSALTDVEKALKSPGHRNAINKMYGTGKIGSTVSRYGNHLFDSVYNMVDNASQNGNSRWSSSAQGLGAAMRAMQQARMSGATRGAGNRGRMVGSALASAAPFFLQQMIRNRMEQNPRANGLGHNLSYYAESAPGLVNSWLRNRQQFDEHYNEFDPNNKWYTRLQKGVLNPLMNNALFNIPITQGNKTRVTTPGIKDLMQPAQWDMMSRRSLVEVIPGLLTQQVNLLKKMAGDDSPEVAFNHRQGAFTTKARVKADVRASIFNRSEFQSAAGSFNSMVEVIDPDEELSPNARVALAMRFARDADAGDGFNINNYLGESGWVGANKDAVREINDFLHKRFDTKEATGKAKLLGKYQIGDSNEVAELRKRVANNMQSQQNYMPNVEDAVNSLANGGQRAMLKEMGVIQRVNGKEVFNHDMYWKMMEKFISNPNFRPDAEDEEGPPDLKDRIDKGALGDLANKAKGKVKGAADDLGLSDAAANAKGKVDDILNRGKGIGSAATARLRASMTTDALSKFYADCSDKYDAMVDELRMLQGSSDEHTVHLAIAQIKERTANMIRQVKEQLHNLDPEEMGQEAYDAAQKRGAFIVQSLQSQLKGLSITSLRSGVGIKLDQTQDPIAEPVKANRVPVSEPDMVGGNDEPAPEVILAGEQNDLLRELISITASTRDQVSAAKDATMAQITGDPNIINNGMAERKGFLKSLGERMKGRETSKLAKAFGMGRLYSSGVFQVTKWATVGPAMLGFAGAKALWKFFRKKKDGAVGDTDGDGIRENSWLDQLRKKKNKAEKEKTDKDGKPKEKPTSIFGLLSGIWSGVTGLFGGITKYGILGGLASFLKLDWLKTLGSWIGGLIKGKDALDTGSDLADLLGDGGGDEGGDEGNGRDRRSRRERARDRLNRRRDRARPRGGLLRRGGRMLRRGAGKVARGILGEPGRMAGRASWLLNGGAKTLAKRIPIVGSLAMSGFEMYNSWQDDDGLGMSEAAGGGLGGVLGGAAMGAAIGSVVPVVGTFIGGVVGAGLGAMAGSSIGSSIYKWINSPGLLQQMRLYQYGLDSIKSDYTGKIFALEAGLEKYVKVTDSGKAMLDPKAPLAELARPFIENPDDRDEVESFGGWFVQRFKPVFLTHYAVAKQLFPGTKFSELDDSKDNAAKYEMAKRCQQFDESIDHPYRWTGMLFKQKPALDYKQTNLEVQEVVNKLKAAVKDTDKNAKSVSSELTGTVDRTVNQNVSKDVIDAIKPLDGKKMKGVNLDGHQVSGGWGQEVTVVSVQDVLGSILPSKGQTLDDVTAARMKIYGLPNLDISKVSTLLQLELVIQNRIQFTGKGVHFTGKTKEVFDIMASSFGHGWLSTFAFTSWSKWFSRRFLPAYLAFASTVYNQVGDDKPTLSAQKLPPETKLMIINAMSAQTYNDGRVEKSVWTVSDSPWSDLDSSNTDATVMDVHINNLKAQAKQAQYETAPVKGGVKQDGTTDKEWRKDNSTGQQVTDKVKGSDGLVRTSDRQETTYDPATGKTNAAYGGSTPGVGKKDGGGLDNVGEVEPLKPGPGTEEGARAMIREAVKNGITDKKELAIMLANTHHETGGFKNVAENLRYRPETLMKLWPKRFPDAAKAQQVASGGPVTIANTIYGNRMGNDQPGDGYKYRGRGFIQLTGKDNYARASKALGVDLVSDPDQVSDDPDMAAASALYFWKANKAIGAKAKAGDVAGVRKIINGGTIGLQDTEKLAQQYMQTLDGGQYDDIISGKDKGDTGTTSDGGSSMEEMMGQSAQEQAQKEGAAPAGSTTNAAPAAGTPPAMTSTTGPSDTAAANATSVTPTAQDSTASADPTALNKTDLQAQAPAAPAAPAEPIPVSMNVDDTHAKATAANTQTTNDKLDEMIAALNQIAGTNKVMAEKETTAPLAAAAQDATPQVQASARSTPVGSKNSPISMKRSYN